jgi:penicillin-binding protein 1A
MDHEGLARLSRRRQRPQVKRQKRDRTWSVVRIAVVGLVSVFLASVVALVGTFAYTYAQVAEDLPELDQYSTTELAQTSVVYDSTGNVVDELHGVQNRFVVGLDEIDPTLRDAVIAIEDHRFYEYRGVDFEAISRPPGRTPRACPSGRVARRSPNSSSRTPISPRSSARSPHSSAR